MSDDERTYDELGEPADERPGPSSVERQLGQYVTKKYGEQAKSLAPRFAPMPDPGEDPDESGVWSRINFHLKPEELVAYLDQYIVRQDEAKAVLATKICTHFNRARYLAGRDQSDPADGVGLIKNNVLMIGPTGVGKTYMVKLIAAKLGVPFVKGDATKFSETGYVGGDVEDLIRELVHEADDDIELAQYGIVYIDEVDKIASTPNLIGPDVSRTGVQRNLLKPMEETEVDLKVAHDPISQIQAIEKYRKTGKRERRTVNTRHILFIMSGAFNELAEVIKRRLNQGAMGFGGKVADPGGDLEYIKQLTALDLVEFGFENEFVGRLPITVVLDDLDADDLLEILKNPNNPVIVSKKRDFAAYGIDLRFEESALRVLADQAATMSTGARALVSVVEKALLPFETRLPSTEIKRLLVTLELVADPAAALERLLEDPAGDVDAERFEQAGWQERLRLLQMVAQRQSLYTDRLGGELTPARMDLVADEYYRCGMSLGTAFERVIERLTQLREIEYDFLETTGIRITFGETAEVAMLAGAAASKASPHEYWARISQDLEHGLRLVADRTGINEFLLPEQAILDTAGYLEDVVQTHLAGLPPETRMA